MLAFQTRICNLHTAAVCSHVTMLSALEDEKYICLQGDRFIFILSHAGPANKDCMAEHSHKSHAITTNYSLLQSYYTLLVL
jgi:hypothetical protein